MNKLLFRATSLVAGLLFGLGMVVSGMADPAKVIGFLDVAGTWDPSLMFVMGGALAIFMPAYFFLIKPKAKPVNAEVFCLANNTKIDRRLISGSVIFGLGWGFGRHLSGARCLKSCLRQSRSMGIFPCDDGWLRYN